LERGGGGGGGGGGGARPPPPPPPTPLFPQTLSSYSFLISAVKSALTGSVLNYFLNNDLDILVGQRQIRPVALVKGDHARQGLLDVVAWAGRAGDQQFTGTPGVVLAVFHNGDVEFLVQARQDRFDPAAFVLERMAVRQVNG